MSTRQQGAADQRATQPPQPQAQPESYSQTPPESHSHAHHEHHAHAHGGPLAVMALAALGVVYGDIGTSPLYALRECFSGPHGIPATPANIMGVLSLIFWSMIIVITIKYVTFILRADNRGEGGILAITALATPIRRHKLTGRPWIVMLGLFGAALLYGDGVITPAISVLSAVEGLKVAAPVLEPYVLPITIGIIVGLFLIQRWGTASIGKLFGPVMLVWFGTLAVLGVINIFKHDPGVFAALNPLYAMEFFAHEGWHGFLVLGTVFLVVTGGEALYADMGHFGARPIRWAWLTLVLPALMINYLGQGALLLHNPEAAATAFYSLAPEWALIPLVILATLATIIASQALISGAYSITMQAENLGFLPRMHIVHTSPTAFGQIYIPFINWLLMGMCILVVLGFRSSSNLAAAYGIAVTSTMAITTLIFAVVARERWGWSKPKVAIIAGLLLIVDLAFLGANIVKIPNGGWFPLVVAVLIFAVMTTWKRGNRLVFSREQDLEMRLDRLLLQLNEDQPTRVPGTAIFLSANPVGAPAALLANLKHNCVIHEQVLLVTVINEDVSYVNPQRRLIFEPLGEGLYRVTVRYGFMEEPNLPAALAQLNQPELVFDPQDSPYFVNRTRAISTSRPGMARWREHLYTVMRHNAASATDFFRLPPARVFEINTAVEI